MKIFIPNISNTKIGGGWTFLDNFLYEAKSFSEIEIVNEISQADLLFSFAPNTVDMEHINLAKSKNIPVVMRVDGVPEDSRNSGRGTGRLIGHTRQADFIVYQSDFISNTLGKILAANGVTNRTQVIHNGVNTKIFNPDGPKKRYQGQINIAHIGYRKDNNKRFEEVVAMMREVNSAYGKRVNLVLIGRFPTEWRNYNFGFFNGESYQYEGVIADPVVKAMALRSCDFLFYPSFADPAPNSVLEAMACGLPVVFNQYGGVREMVKDAGVALSEYINYSEMPDHITQKREWLSKTAWLRVQQHYTLTQMMQNYITVFQNALTNAKIY